jgi:hypothetical protein
MISVRSRLAYYVLFTARSNAYRLMTTDADTNFK